MLIISRQCTRHAKFWFGVPFILNKILQSSWGCCYLASSINLSNSSGSTANTFNISSSIWCMWPATTNECRGPPRSTEVNCRNVPAAICWVSEPTLATPTQIVSSVYAGKWKKKWMLTINKWNLQNYTEEYIGTVKYLKYIQNCQFCNVFETDTFLLISI